MIDDFKAFGLEHLFGLIIPALAGALFIAVGLRSRGGAERRRVAELFVLTLILVRGSRYVMDAWVGRFDIFDLLSLQLCHIDLILLVICLLKPNRIMFHYCFLIGIPMGLAVALFPGSTHPAPGLPRAVLFIMSHMLLVMGPIYLSTVEKMRLRARYLAAFICGGNLFLLAAYFINRFLGTNFLYIMYAPEGTLIEKLAGIFGYPGYVFAMDGLAVAVMSAVFGVEKACLALASLRAGKTHGEEKEAADAISRT